MTDVQKEAADTCLQDALKSRNSRLSFLKTAAAAGMATAGVAAFRSTAGAQTATSPDTAKQIFTIARTAERLAVTFYTNGVNNAAALGLTGNNLDEIKAALIEEQIHELFFAANGGDVLASTFSFPKGAATFTDLPTFIATQQALEGVFDSAFIAAAEEFAQMGNSTVARIAVQIAMIESEHRALGRRIGGLTPASNWAYAPKLLPTVGAAPGVVTQAGFLSPSGANSYSYAQVDFGSANLAPIYAKIMYKEGPFAA